MNITRLSPLVVASVLASSPATLAQQTIVVPDDIPTLELALNPAASGLQPGDTIELTPGTYFGTFTIATPDITIRTAGGMATIDPFGTGRAFTISAMDGTTRFENLRVVNGDAGEDPGGAIFTDSARSVEISGCEFDSNTANQGGAVSTANAELFVQNSVFTNNTATGPGGAMRASSDGAGGPIVVSITGSLFDGNSALDRNGGAIDYGVSGGGVDSSLEMADTVFRDNTCTSRGGGVFVSQVASVSVTRCQFVNNRTLGTVSEDTGGLIIGDAPNVTVSDCDFQGNSCPGSGGALRFSNSAGDIFNSRFIGNSASAGGAVQIVGPNAGANIYNSRFERNSARNAGSEDGEGGAILVNSGFPEVYIYNALFVENTAVTGGAITATSEGEIFVYNSTFVGNDADALGGAVRRTSSTADTVLNSCIVTGNIPTDSQIAIGGGGLDQVNFSLVEGGYTDSGTGNIDADPMFLDADNGDFSLMPGSPAIDAGSSIRYVVGPFSDLAGNDRVRDDTATADTGEAILGAVIDIGAFEFNPDQRQPTCRGDSNSDGTVSAADLLDVIGNFGNPCP